MIPLRDINPTRRFPVVTYTLIALNVAVFLLEVVLGHEGQQAMVERFGVVPDVITGPGLLTPRSQGGGLGALVTPFTSMFLHGGWMHILGNMWFLHVFGDNVEDSLGRGRFVLFYLLSGLGAAAAQVLIDPSSAVPMVGASGAISGVMAGYVMLYPRARVVTLVPIFILVQFVELPAFLFIFVWFGMQVLNGYASLAVVDGAGGVAWFAHIGGFVVGIALVWLMARPRPGRPRRDPPELDRRPRFDRAYH